MLEKQTINVSLRTIAFPTVLLILRTLLVNKRGKNPYFSNNRKTGEENILATLFHEEKKSYFNINEAFMYFTRLACELILYGFGIW